MIHHIVPEQVAVVIRDLVRAATAVGEASIAFDGKKTPIVAE